MENQMPAKNLIKAIICIIEKVATKDVENESGQVRKINAFTTTLEYNERYSTRNKDRAMHIRDSLMSMYDFGLIQLEVLNQELNKLKLY